MRFVDGLRDDIKNMVIIQWPATFDTTCALALVQEESMDSGKQRSYRCFEPSFNKTVQRSTLSHLAPSKTNKTVVGSIAEDKRSTEAARATTTDDKLRALKQYCRARGLCDKCAEKWTHGHKCSTTV
jgi:hypothetical protein